MITWLRQAFLLLVALVIVTATVFPIVHAQSVGVTVGVGDTTARIQGSASPGALVTFMDGASVIGTTTADSLGEFSQVFTDQPPGLHTYQIFAQDTVGRLTDTVTISASLTDHQETVIEAFLPPTLALSDNEVTQGEPIFISGMTVPQAEVIVYVDDHYEVVTANALGQWGLTLDTQTFSAGEHQVYAVAVKTGGEQSYPTRIRTIIIHDLPGQEVPGVPPAPSTPGQSPIGKPVGTPEKPRITKPTHESKIPGGWVEVCGTAEPFVQIELWNRGQLVGSVFANGEGKWCLQYYLTEYLNDLQARACRGRVCSDFSGGIRVFREAPRPSGGLDLTLNRYRLQAFVDERTGPIAKITGGVKPYALTVEWGDGDKTILQEAGDVQRLSHAYKEPGKFNGIVIATDKEGDSDKAHFSVEVVARPGVVSWLTFWLLPAVVVAGVGVLSLWRFYPRRKAR